MTGKCFDRVSVCRLRGNCKRVKNSNYQRAGKEDRNLPFKSSNLIENYDCKVIPQVKMDRKVVKT